MDSVSKKKKKNGKKPENEHIQFRIEVAKPGSKKYTHVDWEELLKNRGVEKDEDMLRRFYDEDTLFMAKKLGETRSKSGKQIRVNLDHIQYLNRNCGYDMDDDFIDDTEAVDDMLTVTKKGGFYVGKGDVKTLDDDDEDDEEEWDEDSFMQLPETSQKQKKKAQKEKEKEKEKKKSSPSSSSSSEDSESEPVRMTGAPPTSRMTGAPPTRRIPSAKRPTSPTRSRSEEKDKGPPPEKKKKEAEPESRSDSPDIVIMEVEEPVKKPPPPPPPVQTISSSSTITIASTPSTSPQKPAQTPSTSTATSSLSPSKSADASNISAMVTKIFTTLMSKLKESKKKGVKTMDRVTIQEIRDLRRISAHHSINQDTLMKSFANTLGISYEEFKKQIFEHAKSDTMDWKLSASDLPHLGEADIAKMTTIVKSWKSKKQLPNTTLTAWLKDVNSTKMSVDQARVKLFEYVNGLPDVEKSRDAGVDLPKHERSRKARMFLHQWVYLSRKYVEMILPTLKRPTTDGYAAKQLEAVNALKDAVKKQVTLFAAKKDKFTDAVYQFQFTEPVLAAIWTYLDELIDYTLAIGNLEMLVKAIDTLYHQCLDTKITLIQFYVELCRRFQKLSFLTVEEPMKSRLIKAKEQIVKHQVVQNPKYMIKWPDGVEPSLRGFNKDLQITDFDTTILAKPKPAEPKTVATPTKPAPVLNKPAAPPAAKPPAVLKPAAAAAPLPKPPSTSNLPSTSTSKPTPTPLATRQPTEEERRAMNQVVQVYLGKYLLASGGSSTTAEICDPTTVPMNDEQLVAMVTAIYATGVPIVNQIVMLKNILAHVGQSRMAQSIVAQKSKTQQLSTKEYQLLFDYFQKYDKALDARKLRVKEAEEKEQKKAEERAKKEREKQLEKEKKEKEKEQERVRKEQEKVEERERKEREKREEKERKEREIREAADRKRREEEDRRLAIERIRIQQEDERRKREAQDAVQKELERRARMETEAANALQFLEEDNLMDDVDFVAEQQSRVDQERKKVEEKRAVERQNQIKMMRAKQLEREVVDVPRPTTSSQPEAHEVSRNGNSQQLLNSSEMAKTKFSQNSMDIPSTSTSSFPPAQPPLNQARNSSNFSQKIVKQEPNEHQFDILGAAQEAAGLTPEHSVKKEPVGSPAPGTPKSSAFDQLARLRGRTMSADVRRASEHSGGAQYQTNGNGVMVGQGAFNASSPLHHPPAQQQFFPQETMVVQQQNIPRMSSHHQNSPLNNVSNQMYFANGNGNAQHMQQHVEPSQQQQQQQNVNRRPMINSQLPPTPSSSTSSSTSTSSFQQFPQSYQSPSHVANSMSNSSLMHTPMSNVSEFSSSPMSQQFHTPPSVGMVPSHPIMSPQNAQNQSHFSNNYQSPQQQQQQPSMMMGYSNHNHQMPIQNHLQQRNIQQQQIHRQMSQQQLQMQQLQQQQMQQMMRQQHHHNYPPH